MQGPREGLPDFASIDALLQVNSPSAWDVAQATWAMDDLSAVDLAGHYTEANLTKLIQKLTNMEQRSQQSRIAKLNEAIQFKRGEREAPRAIVSQLLSQEQIPYVDHQVTAILTELRQAYQNHVGDLDFDHMYQLFKVKIVPVFNALELVRLYEDLKRAVGEANAKTIFTSWHLLAKI